ncbi:MAG: NADH-quinone oxidoreductase subunit N [Pirellulaceae bacterium]
MFVNINTIFWLWPEIILILVACGIYLGGTWSTNRTSWSQLALVSYVAAGFILLRHEWSLWNTQATLPPSGPLAIDALGHWVRAVSLLIGILFTGLYWKGTDRRLASEFLGTLMMAIVGLMLVSRANHLIVLFLGLELVSIPTYILLFLSRSDPRCLESTTKYFFLNILSSAVLLYGFSFLYGATGTMVLMGTTDMPGIRESIITQLSAGSTSINSLLTISVILILGGLGFKIAAAPFHFYAADVYQGTSNATAGFLSIVPKAAGFVALIRLLALSLPATTEVAWQVLFVMSVLTMTVGNVCALWQQNIRRLLAYSSIAHTGYMLMGLAAATAWVVAPASETTGSPPGGIAALLLYLLFYCMGTIGIFAALTFLGNEEEQVDNVDQLSGLSGRHPTVAAALAICLFSLAGIPPLAGFWGKFTLFVSALSVSSSTAMASMFSCFMILAVVAALNAAVPAAYYLRLIGVMYFNKPSHVLPARGHQGSWLVMAVATSLIIMIGFLPGRAIRSVRKAEQVQEGRLVERIHEDISKRPIESTDPATP